MNILSLVREDQIEYAREALYYCLRALKQAGLSEDAKKDYFFDTEASAPSEDAVALASFIVSEITKAEGADVDAISEEKIGQYVSDVADAINTLSSRTEGFDIENGMAKLEELRSRAL